MISSTFSVIKYVSVYKDLTYLYNLVGEMCRVCLFFVLCGVIQFVTGARANSGISVNKRHL